MVRFLLALLASAALGSAHAEDVSTAYPQVRDFFPEADRFGTLEGVPPAAPVYRGERLVGYVFLSSEVVRIPAYSGRPINTLVGFDLSGRIAGVSIVQHEEPILVIGITDARLKQFTDQYRGKSVFDRIVVGAARPGAVAVDTISGATITVMVENATIQRSARLVAESRGVRLAEVAQAAPAAVAATAERPAPEAATPVPEKVAPPTRAAPAKGPAPPAAKPGPDRRAPAAAPTRAEPPSAAGTASPLPVAAAPQEEPLWVSVWQARKFQIAVLVVGLAALTSILVFQDWFARRPLLLKHVRRAFLAYTVLFIGWYALAQLSVVHVLTFVHAATRDFRWENFLIDPMLFILWSFVAVTLLLWGRGVYCGWLCPYGAAQELVQQAARRLGLPQLEFPNVVHERLWAVKYIVLLLLFGVSLQSLGDAVRYAEVEPFKTAVTLRFQREWPFVLYAGGLLLVSAFNRKFFCKYVCPLGAALSIPGRFRIFDWWLRRRRECGRPCQTCATECEVRAIRPTGEINANECHYCLDCQVTYYSDAKCPPLAERRKRQERAVRAVEVVRGIESGTSPARRDDAGREAGAPREHP
jgi:polyferredoxin